MTADHATRERLLDDLDATFFVEAGAGTGKTTLVVGRIVNLVAAGRVRIEELAAITFTEAAAAELRDRVREGLERAAAQPGAERLAAARGEEQALAALLDLAELKTPGNQQRWERIPGGPNACAAIKQELKQVRDRVIIATLERHRQAVFARVLGVLRDFVLGGVEQRRARRYPAPISPPDGLPRGAP